MKKNEFRHPDEEKELSVKDQYRQELTNPPAAPSKLSALMNTENLKSAPSQSTATSGAPAPIPTDSNATSMTALDAIAKSKGRRYGGDSRKYQRRQMPTSNVRGKLSSRSSTNPVDLGGDRANQKSKADTTAKAKGKCPVGTVMSKRNSLLMKPPASASTTITTTLKSTLNRREADISAKARAKASSPYTIKRLNRMVADVASKGETDARRKPAASGVATAEVTKYLNQTEADVARENRTKTTRTNGSDSTASVDVKTSLNQVEVDVAPKKVERAGITMKGVSVDQYLYKNKNNNIELGFNHAVAHPGVFSSSPIEFEGRAVAKNKKMETKNDIIGVGDTKFVCETIGSKATNEQYETQSEDATTTAAVLSKKPPSLDCSIETNTNSLCLYDSDDRLAVAVAVNEEEDENAYIPSAVEYDPDAKLPMYKNQRFRIYGILGCTLLIVIAACTIGVLAILEGESSNETPTEAPTCVRCSIGFEEQMELEVGSQKLNDPTTGEYQAKEWIIHDDPMQLQPTDPNLIQRFLLAAFYFDTHKLGDWRSCNKQDEKNDNEDETCLFMRVSSIDPLEFESTPANRWLSSYSECYWAGVMCDEMERLRIIDIHGQEIQGTLPNAFTQLPYVQTIALQWNNFTGTLPEEMGRMKHLIHVELHENDFTGSFPTTWSNARNLQVLNIAKNSLSGQLPPEIGNFRNIKGLFLYKNLFSGSLPPELSKSKSMAYARFQKNSFSGTINPGFGDMQLTELWLHGNPQLTGSIPSELGKLSNFMSDLRLSETSLEGTIPEELFSIVHLWRLDLSESSLSGTISTNITELENLQVLRLNNNAFTGTIPDDFSTLTNLIELSLHGNKFHGSIPSSICDLREDHMLESIKADCLPDPTTGKVLITCDCCDVCCSAETGECSI